MYLHFLQLNNEDIHSHLEGQITLNELAVEMETAFDLSIFNRCDCFDNDGYEH